MMKKQLGHNSTSCVEMRISSHTLKYLGGECSLKWHQKAFVLSPEAAREGTRVNQETSVRFKILSHFIKGKNSFSPMEIILMILGELKHLESPVKLAKRKKDVEVIDNQVYMVSVAPTLR
jgi:hypothetical protein